jgi:hypothetical protein
MQIILVLKTPTSYVYSLRKCIGKDGIWTEWNPMIIK